MSCMGTERKREHFKTWWKSKVKIAGKVIDFRVVHSCNYATRYTVREGPLNCAHFEIQITFKGNVPFSRGIQGVGTQTFLVM